VSYELTWDIVNAPLFDQDFMTGPGANAGDGYTDQQITRLVLNPTRSESYLLSVVSCSWY